MRYQGAAQAAGTIAEDAGRLGGLANPITNDGERDPGPGRPASHDATDRAS